VVVDDLHVLGARVGPSEADSPLLVDPNAVRAGAVALELLESVPGWYTQIVEGLCGIEDEQLSERGTLHPLVELAHALSLPSPLRLFVGERP
jgi:hypothetical protein